MTNGDIYWSGIKWKFKDDFCLSMVYFVYCYFCSVHLRRIHFCRCILARCLEIGYSEESRGIKMITWLKQGDSFVCSHFQHKISLPEGSVAFIFFWYW